MPRPGCLKVIRKCLQKLSVPFPAVIHSSPWADAICFSVNISETGEVMADASAAETQERLKTAYKFAAEEASKQTIYQKRGHD